MKYKIPVANYSSFGELPLSLFDEQKFAIYILDLDWNYLFVNKFACQNLHLEVGELDGKNMWDIFPAYRDDPSFVRMRKDIEANKLVDIVTVSPITAQRVNILGHAMSDCIFFTVSILPLKDELLNELRDEIKKKTGA